ncbi:MAG: condensation domain-containing protein [Pseudomonadota bacterium]
MTITTTTIQHKLSEIWRAILKRDVPLDAGFSALGGSSIQLISMLLHVGNDFQVEIDIGEFLDQPTIAQLTLCIVRQLDVAAPVTAPVAEQAQTFPLLPVHYWLFERIDVNHFNVGHLFKLEPGTQRAPIRAAIEAVLRQHDGLRILLRKNEAGAWHQHLQAPAAMSAWWSEVDLASTPDAELAQAIERVCNEHHAAIRVETRAFQAVYFDLGAGRGARLFILLHHILIDNISERVLLRDIESAYRQVKEGQPVRLNSAGRSVGSWARLLHDYAQGQALEHVDYWMGQSWDGYQALPPDPHAARLPPADGPMAALDYVHAALSADDSARLVAIQQNQGIDASYVVMAAMTTAVRNWSGSEVLALAMVHNGRRYQSIVDANVLQTVGWMINYATLFLRNPARPGAARLAGIGLVQSVARQATAVGDDGLSLTCLKYMNQDPAVRSAIARVPPYQIGFNFIPFALGEDEPDFVFERAPESSGEGEKWFDPHIKPFINAYFSGGQLRLTMGFSPCMYGRATIAALLDDIAGQMHTILHD